MKRAWLINTLSELLPYDAPLRTGIKRLATDARTLSHMGRSWEHINREPPVTISIETTNICNADCVFCAYRYQDVWRKGKGTMSDELFNRILREFAEMGGSRISFTPIVGDPLVDKKIVPRVAQAIDAGFHVYFYTNGILLDRVDPDALLDTGLKKLLVSTAPLDEEMHKRIYRTNGYQGLITGLERLLKVRNARKSKMHVRLEFRSDVPTREALAVPDFRDRIAPLLTEDERTHVGFQIKSYDTWGGLISQSMLPGEMKIAPPPRIKNRPCERTRRPQILWDGKVRACSCIFAPSLEKDADDGLLLGDLNHQSLREIYYGDKLRALRQSFVDGKRPGICNTCTLYQGC